MGSLQNKIALAQRKTLGKSDPRRSPSTFKLTESGDAQAWNIATIFEEDQLTWF
jgi:hypothetical protein